MNKIVVTGLVAISRPLVISQTLSSDLKIRIITLGISPVWELSLLSFMLFIYYGLFFLTFTVVTGCVAVGLHIMMVLVNCTCGHFV